MLLGEPGLSEALFHSITRFLLKKKKKISQFCFSLLSPISPEQKLPSYAGK